MLRKLLHKLFSLLRGKSHYGPHYRHRYSSDDYHYHKGYGHHNQMGHTYYKKKHFSSFSS